VAVAVPLLLALLTFVILEAIKRIRPDLPDSVKIPLAFAIAIGITFLVAAAKSFGHTTLVNDEPVDAMDWASKVIVGILVGAGAVGIDYAQKAIKNIGQNQGS
jgi:hypothetical protein